MSKLVYDEYSYVDNQIYKYDQFIHSRINKYTGEGRTPVIYYNQNDDKTTMSLGFGGTYNILGPDSSLRYNKIDKFFLVGVSPLSATEGTVNGTEVRNIKMGGQAFVMPGTVMPKENDFFIIKEINMNNLFRVISVDQDSLNTNGWYKFEYELFTTDPKQLECLEKQVVGNYIMDLRTIGGTDLTPVIGKNDYELRSRLISMIDDMTENYVAQFYDPTHNCFLLKINGEVLFDVCGNYFMAKHCVMTNDNSYGNVVLNQNKLNQSDLNIIYQRSPYKWIERDAPLRYLQQFKYRKVSSNNFVDSSFYRYGLDVEVMIPGDAWCNFEGAHYYFPLDVCDIFRNVRDIRECNDCNCPSCPKQRECIRQYKLQRYDYISIIHDFIHGKLTSINDLSLLTGDQLFDLTISNSKEVYLWTPLIIYILKQVLKIQ